MIILIAALAKNNVIGKNGDLPWHISDDLKRFKTLTLGKTVLMGRKTFESILRKLGKPLPGRKNVVITKNTNYKAPEEVVIYHNLDKALADLADDTVFIIGGGEIYKKTLDRADVLYLTHVDTQVSGDTFFPKIDLHVWKKQDEEKHEGYSFATYIRE